MPSHKSKTLSYRRAVWVIEDNQSTLEAYLRKAATKLKNVKSRTFEKNPGNYLKGLTISPIKNGAILLHIVAETPGDQASILQVAQDVLEHGSVGTSAAPAGAEFMDGDIFIYCKDDEVCICSSSLREASVAWFCKKAFEAARLGSASLQFELQKVADASRVKLINQEGVREIQFGATLYDATLSHGKRLSNVAGAMDAAGRHISALFGSDKTPTPDNLKIAVVLKTDDRMRGGVTLGRKRISKLAKELLSSDSSYTILTRSGKTISSDAINMKKTVEIKVHGKSVDRNAAWGELKFFYDEIVSSGVVQI